MEILYFGILSDIAGKKSESIEAKTSLSRLIDSVEDTYPELKKMSYVVSRNGTITHGDPKLEQGDSICLIPPAPGG